VRLHAELEHWLANGAGRLPDSPSLAGLNWKDGH
jgi:hypothetical protein